MSNQGNIRNFTIIGHIDHGKSTLADRLLEATGTLEIKNENQVLDSHPIARERGVTIKMAAVRMVYQNMILNLIDTPGHVDFSYEVSRALAACEGALLVVDAVSGIQAQTVAHFESARKQNLKIIPLINKIDLPDTILDLPSDLEKTFGFKKEEIIFISAKKNLGIDEVLKAIIERIPAPGGISRAPFRALVFNAGFDPYKGMIVHIKAADGSLKKKEKIRFLAGKVECQPKEIGFLVPSFQPADQLSTGEVGYIATGLKDISLARVGETVILAGVSSFTPLPGYKEPKPLVFMGIYPRENRQFPLLKAALSKLKLSDASLVFKEETAKNFGRGFKCGFLGLFHAEIVQERLKRDYQLETIAIQPQVEYQNDEASGEIYEPWSRVIIFTPKTYLGKVMELADQHRGIFKNMTYHGGNVELGFEMPLSEIIFAFFDKLKSVSNGFANFDYEMADFRPVKALKLSVLVNREKIDSLSQIVVKEFAFEKGKKLARKLKETIPRQLIPISIQVALNGKIIAREDIPSLRKDVTQKLYGGDYTRKLKLLDKQKEGKKKMRRFGKVEIPQEAFLTALSL